MSGIIPKSEIAKEAGLTGIPVIENHSGSSLADEICEILTGVGIEATVRMKKREINRHAMDALFYDVRVKPQTKSEEIACVIVAHEADCFIRELPHGDGTYKIICGR